ncbi:MAG: tail fiber domain-containing protein [Saprospiraceae bacterium]|nr:tail fiber domain-containing protein [Saprospiraceae bacterium]
MSKSFRTQGGLTLVFILLACFGATLLQAQNAALTVQGILKKSDGSAVPDDVYKLIFAFYDAEVGGNKVWEETINDVETTGGVYSVVLGVGTPLTASFNVPYYLSVKIGSASAQELLPRPRLSAAPYALALRGQDNVIPSTGNIQVYGVTASHAITASGNISGANISAGGDLNVGNDAYLTGTLNVQKGVLASTGPINSGTGPFHGYGFLGDGNTGYGSDAYGTASIWAGGENVLNATNNQVLIRPGGVDVINATNAQVTMTKPLHITGLKTLAYGGTVYSMSGAGFQTLASYTSGFSLETDGYIKPYGVYVISDRRVKKDFTPSNPVNDLALLQRLSVTDYKYKDVITKGDVWKKGFIAQQVAEVVPEAVSKGGTDVIPDIYAPAKNARLEASTLFLTMEQAHGLKPGDKVRLMGDDQQEDLLVQTTPSATTFTVGNWTYKAPEKVFVYGREVTDFHSVDYDRLFTLNISATQELARRVEALEKENTDYKAENAELRRLIEGIRADVNALKGLER